MHEIHTHEAAPSLEPGSLKYAVTVRSFGVDVLMRTNSKRVLNAITKTMDSALAGLYTVSEPVDTVHTFNVFVAENGRIDIYQDGDLKYVENDIPTAMYRMEASVRLKVAEYAVRRVFVHSGAVGWKGKGIIFPARSFNGKSSLTAALVRRGARYFSDEYAVIGRNGHLHPFPKALSLRGQANPYAQVDHPVESIGGKPGKRPVPVRLIVLTSYEARAKWRPKRISEGQAVLGVLNNAVGIRRDPSFVLPVITRMCSSAAAFTSKRGDADETASRIIEMVESLF